MHPSRNRLYTNPRTSPHQSADRQKSALNTPVNGQMEHGYSVTKIILFVLVLFVSTAHSETQPAHEVEKWVPHGCVDQSCTYGVFDSRDAAVSSDCAAKGGLQGIWPDNSYLCYNGFSSIVKKITYTGCDAGWVQTGSSCTRPDCVAPQVRDEATGACIASPCTAGEATSAQGWANAWVICEKASSDCVSGPKTVPSSYCDGSCTSTVDSWSGCFPQGVGSVDSPAPLYCTYVGKKTGETCSQSNLPQPTNPPVIPQKTPPCLATEGVLTSSSGSVKCVPAGTPSAEKPVVTKQTSTQNFPDGSSKVTETTTTRDPATGAESKDTKVTNTPATGGGPGQAGPVGSAGGTTEEKQVVPNSNSGSGEKGDQSSDFCAKNPNLQICKGDMSKEETQKAIKDLLDPKDPANTDSVTAEKNGYEEKATAHKQFIDAFASKGQNNEGFLSWAWIPEVPASSCVPFSGVVGGKTITLDWCDKLGMIREIAGYMFYILTAFGLFRIFANSTGATS